ncbi:MAG: NlpC/P60 family protein [Methylobacillus sp.]|nr:NlpC/P60 family protein [Methylobacillus sp.]
MKSPTALIVFLLLNPIPTWATETTAMQQFRQEAMDATQAWTDSMHEVLLHALSLTGIKYTYGGKSPETGFDCSGFVRYVFQQSTSMTLPHGAKAISQLGQPVPQEQLQPGDLVFFNTLRSAFSHVGIYLGNQKFIHAPSSGGGVQVVDMSENYWAKRFNGARRIVNSQ